MKRFVLLCLVWVVPCTLFAGVTTYTFTSVKWASRVDATVCDGVTDGWVCDKEASDYNAGRTYADGSLNSAGVGVKTGSSGAGATSVIPFEEVRQVTVNFCQNASKGRGTINVQVGDNTPYTITVTKPATSGSGTLNRDSVIQLTTPETGKIKFWVDCTENGIYINTITIRSSSGGSSTFTMDTYQLVTDITQLEDSDQVIVGVRQDGVNYVMGYYDEWESVNNIHAIKARYSADRSQVDADDRAVYTLRISQLDGQTAYIFQDELRYEEAYLVASGGQTKNKLEVWTDVVSDAYGNYGYWDIEISDGGEAIITNLGRSLGKILQYNASNILFSCYQNRSQTPVCLYRRVEAIGDVPAIVAPFVNFGTTIQQQGSRTIQVNANRLSEDISATLVKGEVFCLSSLSGSGLSTMLDRDGDELTISYAIAESGHFTDTLVLRSGDTETRVAILLNRINPMTISEAVHQEDYTTVYLGDVTVTKKYDTYIYVRDETGSMLLFDRGDGDKRYGNKLNPSGDVLSGVTGRFVNYYGVPEINLTEQFDIEGIVEVQPEEAGAVIDSADVCRYVVLEQVLVTGKNTLTYNGNEYAWTNKFNIGNLVENELCQLYAIVSYDFDVVTLYIIHQEVYPSTGVSNASIDNRPRVVLRDGAPLILTDHGAYTLTGAGK
jgi:hypothetical protein